MQLVSYCFRFITVVVVVVVVAAKAAAAVVVVVVVVVASSSSLSSSSSSSSLLLYHYCCCCCICSLCCCFIITPIWSYCLVDVDLLLLLSSSWRSQSTRSRPLGRWMMSSSPAPVCSRGVWSSGKCWQATRLLLWFCKGGIFVEHAPWSALLDHKGKLVRVPASVYGAYDCSVCYARCEASPEWPVASGTAGGSDPSAILAL